MKADYRKKDGSFALSWREYSQNHMLENHRHDTYEFYILVSGQRHLFVNEQFFEVSAGDLFLIKPHTPHRTINSGESRYARLTCSFSPAWLEQTTGDRGLFSALQGEVGIVSPAARDAARVRAEIACIKRSLWQQNAGYEFAVQGAVMKMLSLFLAYRDVAQDKIIKTGSYRQISSILQYLNTHYHEPLSVSALAQRFFISEFHMCRLFKQCMGKTMMAYITELRVAKAKQLLHKPGLRIHAVYAQCGFGSLSNFNRCFKMVCGQTPLQYRKSISR